MKKTLKIIGIILLIIILIPVGVVGFLRIIMYDPDPVETVEFTPGTDEIGTGETLSVLTFNIGYAGYSDTEDFFMDGGKGIRPADRDAVMTNLKGIASIIAEENCDITLAQEVDIDAHRSYDVNEDAYLASSAGLRSVFALNYDCVFVPFPVPPIGKVHSGISTYTNLQVAEAQRYKLPDTAPWYMRPGYLKRCVLLERIPLRDSDRELVIMNFHLEAYTDEEKRDLQVEALNKILTDEYDRGNYVIAGGDFNQAFEGLNNPPIISESGWIPGLISQADLPEGYTLVAADNAPSCRSLENPFIDNETSQTYIIDGFILSDNIIARSVEVHDYGFKYSDHNPVRLEVLLKKQQ